ncbi:hypothetical protein H6770_03920 [Candidatus Peribacteria bacterium]|nr:hypothetical protein [Candidatus Peribacteria bacterium]
MITLFQQLAEPWLIFLAEDPALRILQGAMLFLGVVVIFLVFFTTRDILLRTHSFWYMFISILLVAALPVAGFLLYLLIRPARTIKERELEFLLVELLAGSKVSSHRETVDTSAGVIAKKPAPKKKKSPKKQEDISL